MGLDIPFIYATWLNSYRNDSLIGLSVRKSVFFENYRSVLDHLLAKDSTKVYVACAPNDPSVIFGYIVAEPEANVLHYAFTKEAFRGFGIAKVLFKHAFKTESISAVSITASHITRSTKHLCKNYNPFLLFRS